MTTTRTRRPGITRFGALRRVDPVAWRAELDAALAAADGRVTDAARRLGIAPRTLHLALRTLRAAS